MIGMAFCLRFPDESINTRAKFVTLVQQRHDLDGMLCGFGFGPILSNTDRNWHVTDDSRKTKGNYIALDVGASPPANATKIGTGSMRFENQVGSFTMWFAPAP